MPVRVDPEMLHAVEDPTENVTTPDPDPPDVDRVRVPSTPTGTGIEFTVSVACVPFVTETLAAMDVVAT